MSKSPAPAPAAATAASRKKNGQATQAGSPPSRVTKIRKKFGMSQQEFASLLGLAVVSVSRWEANAPLADASEALIALLERALKVKPAAAIITALRKHQGAEEVNRIIELVRLGERKTPAKAGAKSTDIHDD